MRSCRVGDQPEPPLWSPLAEGTVEVAKHIREGILGPARIVAFFMNHGIRTVLRKFRDHLSRMLSRSAGTRIRAWAKALLLTADG